MRALPGLVAAVMLAACAGPPPAAPRARDPFEFAGTPCAATPPSRACCEQAARRAFIHRLADDDGTGQGRYGVAGEFDALADTALATDPYRVHEAARGTACEAVIPVPLAFLAMRDMTPSQAEADLRARAAAACARASKAAAAATDDALRAEGERARACVYGGDERPPDGCDELLGKATSPAVLEVVVCRDARAAVPVGARTLSALVPAVAVVESLEALAARASAAADEHLGRRSWEKAEVGVDDPALAAARTVCKADRKVCEASCEKGEHRACAALAWEHLRRDTPPDFARARALLAAACAAKVERACAVAKTLEGDAQRHERAESDALRPVMEAAGEIALNLAREKAARARVDRPGELARSVDRMESYRATVFAERYCPAKARFVRGFGVRAFEARVAKGCALPTLPPDVDAAEHAALCRAVVARPCP